MVPLAHMHNYSELSLLHWYINIWVYTVIEKCLKSNVTVSTNLNFIRKTSEIQHFFLTLRWPLVLIFSIDPRYV